MPLRYSGTGGYWLPEAFRVSSFLRAALVLVASSMIAVALSVSIIYAADLLIPDFSARADNYALGIGIPLCVAPTLIYPLVRINYRMELVKAELERMVRTDALTGLPNRRAFFEEAGRIFAARTAAPLDPVVVMMADIDHFKQINDRYGHATGDEVLCHVARVIVRTVDSASETAKAFVARIGGEEFAILLTGADIMQAAAVADRICCAVRSAPLKSNSGFCSATISIGISFCAPGESLDAVMSVADKAGYDAKRRGRDRWVVAGNASPSQGPADASPEAARAA